jgi:cell division protein FtsL
MDTKQALQLMQSVDQFYNDSWVHLMLYLTFFIAILGLLVPLLTYLYQKRLFQAEKTELKSYIDEKTLEMRDALKKLVQDLFEAETKKINESFGATIKLKEKELDKKLKEAFSKVDRSFH